MQNPKALSLQFCPTNLNLVWVILSMEDWGEGHVSNWLCEQELCFSIGILVSHSCNFIGDDSWHYSYSFNPALCHNCWISIDLIFPYSNGLYPLLCTRRKESLQPCWTIICHHLCNPNQRELFHTTNFVNQNTFDVSIFSMTNPQSMMWVIEVLDISLWACNTFCCSSFWLKQNREANQVALYSKWYFGHTNSNRLWIELAHWNSAWWSHCMDIVMPSPLLCLHTCLETLE